MEELREIIVFYDDPCIDGAASVWAFDKAFQARPEVNVEYIPLSHGKPEERTQKILEHLTDGAEVFFLDTSPKDDTLAILFGSEEGAPKIRKLTVIDHHASEVARLQQFERDQKAQESCGSRKPDIAFILQASKPAAALLVWEHFHPAEPPPPLLEWIGRMEPPVRLKDTKDYAIAAFIDSKDISSPEKIFRTMDALVLASKDEMETQGNAILADQFNNINKIKTALLYAEFEVAQDRREWIPLVNANVQNFGRRMNEALLDEATAGTTCGIAGAWYVQGDGTVRMSLRSKGLPDVGKTAHYMGETIGITGGGHATDAVVQFRNIGEFVAAVNLCTKEQMLAEHWNPEKEIVRPRRRKPTSAATACKAG